MNEEYSCLPEYGSIDEYPAPPEEYGSKSNPGRSKRKKLAQLMLYSWVMLIIGGAAAVPGGDVQCAVTVYDADGNIVIEQTVPESKLDTVPIPNGSYYASRDGNELVITEGCLPQDYSDSIEPSDDAFKQIVLYSC